MVGMFVEGLAQGRPRQSRDDREEVSDALGDDLIGATV